jgi:protein O-mannosyl-transferase
MTEPTSLIKRYLPAFTCLLIVIALCYGSSLSGDWHLDDHDNIVTNKNIHIKSLNWKEIKNTFQGMDKSRTAISRPLAYLSFALNYYADGLNVFGYHLANVIIHYLASVFLFLFTYNMLRLPIFNGRYEKSAYGIALLSAVLWAASPMQVTAVTYIVQRMASMAGMFYIMAMYFYLKARTSQGVVKIIMFFSLSCLSALAAFGTKQNTVILPVTIVIFDLFFLQGITRESMRRNAVTFGIPLMIVTIASFFILDISMVAGDYNLRPFSMTERLMTQPRIIFLYISFLLYPSPARLMLYHDVQWSTSLIEPVTTLISILAMIIIFVFALMNAKRRPLLSFCILFFFLNHAIESSFLSLELIFEHRNYIPSMLFFLPFSAAAITAAYRYSNRLLIPILITAGMVFFFGAQVVVTQMRNETFQTRLHLLWDNVEKTPRLSVVHHNLGVEYYNQRLYRQSYIEYEKALRLDRYINKTQRYLTYYNMGLYFQYVTKEMDKAKAYYEKAKPYCSNAETQLELNLKDMLPQTIGSSITIRKTITP